MGVQRNLNHTQHTLERVLNIAGYFPVVSSFSGGARAVYGKIEIIGGIAGGALMLIKALFSNDTKKDCARAFQIITTYPIHGFLNIFRGILESVPFLSLFTCLPYDLLGCRVTYPYEGHQVRGSHSRSPAGHRLRTVQV